MLQVWNTMCGMKCTCVFHAAGVFKAGGSQGASQRELLRCIEGAKLRHKEVSELLQQALLDHSSGGEQAMDLN